MRSRPPLTDFVKYPVTAGIAAMAIAVTVLSKTGRSIDGMTMSVQAFEGEPWRILTSALPHGDVLHIVFNVLWLWVFGTAVEDTFGPLRTFLAFVLFQIGAALGEYALFGGGIGLSGIGYGLFGMLYVLSRRDRRFLGAIDKGTTQMFVGWFFLCIVLTATGVMNVGNVAHGEGVLLGGLLGLVLSAHGAARRIAAGVGIAVVLAVSLLGATRFRPLVNVSRDGGADSAALGYEELVAGHHAEAARRFERAVAISPGDAASWYDLGIARDDDLPAALAAYRHAYTLEPADLQYREAFHATLAQGLALAESRGDTGTAGALKRELDALETPAVRGAAP